MYRTMFVFSCFVITVIFLISLTVTCSCCIKSELWVAQGPKGLVQVASGSVRYSQSIRRSKREYCLWNKQCIGLL